MSRLASLMTDMGLPAVREHTGISVSHRPLGVAGSAVTVEGCLFDDSDDAAGAPPVITREGQRVVRRATLEVPISVTVTTHERDNKRDTFVVEGTLWAAVRILGKDSVSQLIELECHGPIETRRGRSA